ncbi:signal transduction histidine kinase [Desulfuromonas soudanensis]|uniref:histidine kinase n=1 Tax=Desulfuromonas soudanensis TaxID=1603606 RepID=A0A0M5IS40_9BACT|nr:ATP-binding protein [Desulfuromonas soudanensis]ALC17774.1 signal transduction histidine kinase [Desulfuromonas soudanensis]
MQKRLAKKSNLAFLEHKRRQIVVYALVYTLAASLLLAAVSILPLVKLLKEQEEGSLLQGAKTRTLAIEEHLSRLADIAGQITSRSVIRDRLDDYRQGKESLADLEAFTRPRLRDAMQHAPEVSGISRFDDRGKLVARTGIPLPPEIRPPAPAVAETTFSDPVTIGNDLYLAVSAPIFHAGKRIGTDIVLFTLYKLQGILWDRESLGNTGNAHLGGGSAGTPTIFFPGCRDEREVYNRPITEPLFLEAMRRSARDESGILRSGDNGGPRHLLLAYTPVRQGRWVLLMTMNEQELYSRVNRQLLSVGLVAVVLALCAGAGMVLLLRPLTGKVLIYSRAMEKLNRVLQEQISDRKQAEENLRRSELGWELTFESITDAVMILDTHGRPLKMNSAAATFLRDLTGTEGGEGVSLGLLGIGGTEEPSPFSRMLESRRPETGELFDPNNRRYFTIAVYPLLDEDGELLGGVHIAHDKTEQKNLEQMKDDLLSSVSHEMRTPLTAMLGFTEFLLEHEVDRDRQRDYLQTVHKETERLSELIGNFLDLQRLQADLNHYSFEPFDVAQLLGEAAHLFSVASKEHSVALELPPEPIRARGDYNRLLQVLKNLLGNAIKYSPGGGTIHLGAEEEEDRVRIWVRDDGMGIPQQALDKIFTKFYRVDDSVRRMPGGVGLGLALAREVLRAHGGRIWAESALGKGSAFYFTLPSLAAEKKTAAE